jgi:hypothetical protein
VRNRQLVVFYEYRVEKTTSNQPIKKHEMLHLSSQISAACQE